jgi:YVTN family beta-propeller protein
MIVQRIFPGALGVLLSAISMQAAPFAYVANANSNSVSVIDSATNTLVATIPVGIFPDGIAITPDGAFAYVTNGNSHNVSVIATATNTVVDTIAVGDEPSRVAITPDGAFAWVTVSNAVWVIEVATNTVVGGILSNSPWDIIFTPDGKFAYVTNSNSSSIAVISTATYDVVTTISVPIDRSQATLAITPDGKYLYVTGGVVIDIATNTVVTTIFDPVGFTQRGIAVTPNGAFVWTTGDSGNIEVISTATNTGTSLIPLAGNLEALAFTPDGKFAYVANTRPGPGESSVISVVATATNIVVATIPVSLGAGFVAFAPSPALVSASPAPASGLSNTFALTYSDAYGASNLNFVGAMFSSVVSGANSCDILYSPPSNLLYLLDDSGTSSSTLTPGSGTISNSQCTINGTGTSVVESGNDLTLNLAVTVSSTYTGKHSTLLFAEDSSPAYTAWVAKGTWTPAANQPPTVGAVTPNPASGLNNTFVLPYSDANGASDLAVVAVIFNSSASAVNSCEVLYAPATNLLYLLNDAGTGSSSITPGSGTLSNSQCTISGSGTSVVRSGAALTLNLDVTASPTYTAAQTIFLFADDNSGANTGLVNAGTWTP